MGVYTHSASPLRTTALLARRAACALIIGGVALVARLSSLRRELQSVPGGARTPEQVQQCVRALAGQAAGAPAWLAVYGDSLARGVFFDTVEALNYSEAAAAVRLRSAPSSVHMGHFANYSTDCAIVESRPPLRRPKCGGFAFDWWPDPTARTGAAAVRAVASALPSTAARKRPHLSFRLKTFTWEPEFDRSWLRAIRRARVLPDALLLSFGIWDMQYPPDNEPGRGVDAFRSALRNFLSAFEAALDPRPYRHRVTRGDADDAAENSALRRRPRLFWLTVPAVSQQRLPEWKRPRMNAALARQYNAVAAPELRRAGITVIDTFESGLAHPELSLDGVHSPGPLSAFHSQLFWRALCGPRAL